MLSRQSGQNSGQHGIPQRVLRIQLPRTKQEYVIPFTFLPTGRVAGDVLYLFPYVSERDQKLHLREIREGKDLTFSQRGWTGPTDGYDAQVVRRKWPRLFELAQEDGFWKDQ